MDYEIKYMVDVIRNGADILDANGDDYCDELIRVADLLEMYYMQSPEHEPDYSRFKKRVVSQC